MWSPENVTFIHSPFYLLGTGSNLDIYRWKYIHLVSLSLLRFDPRYVQRGLLCNFHVHQFFFRRILLLVLVLILRSKLVKNAKYSTLDLLRNYHITFLMFIKVQIWKIANIHLFQCLKNQINNGKVYDNGHYYYVDHNDDNFSIKISTFNEHIGEFFIRVISYFVKDHVPKLFFYYYYYEWNFLERQSINTHCKCNIP